MGPSTLPRRFGIVDGPSELTQRGGVRVERLGKHPGAGVRNLRSMLASGVLLSL